MPLWILVALGRQSDLLIINKISIIFIEGIRGVTPIFGLFTAPSRLNYVLPPGTNFDLMLRVIFMVTLFFTICFSMSRYSICLEKSSSMAVAKGNLMSNTAINTAAIGLSDNIAIQVTGMNKWFGAFHVVMAINPMVYEGERMVIAGPLGSGKSTPTRCISRF